MCLSTVGTTGLKENSTFTDDQQTNTSLLFFIFLHVQTQFSEQIMICSKKSLYLPTLRSYKQMLYAFITSHTSSSGRGDRLLAVLKERHWRLQEWREVRHRICLYSLSSTPVDTKCNTELLFPWQQEQPDCIYFGSEELCRGAESSAKVRHLYSFGKWRIQLCSHQIIMEIKAFSSAACRCLMSNL